MKSLFHKIASFSLAIFVLLSTYSFTISAHFCGGEVVDVSLFEEAESCCGNIKEKDFCSSGAEIHKKNHCSDTTKYVQGNDLEQTALTKLSLPQVYFVVAYFSVFHFNNDFQKEKVDLIAFSPPIQSIDRTVLFENFRI